MTSEAVQAAERALAEALAAEARVRRQEDQEEPTTPVVLDRGHGATAVYSNASEIDAHDLGASPCGYKDPRYSTFGACTRPLAHRGSHGQPNWAAHAEIEARNGFVEVDLRSSHDSRGKTFYSLEQWEQFIAEVDRVVRAGFVEATDGN